MTKPILMLSSEIPGFYKIPADLAEEVCKKLEPRGWYGGKNQPTEALYSSEEVERELKARRGE